MLNRFWRHMVGLRNETEAHKCFRKHFPSYPFLQMFRVSVQWNLVMDAEKQTPHPIMTSKHAHHPAYVEGADTHSCVNLRQFSCIHMRKIGQSVQFKRVRYSRRVKALMTNNIHFIVTLNIQNNIKFKDTLQKLIVNANLHDFRKKEETAQKVR